MDGQDSLESSAASPLQQQHVLIAEDDTAIGQFLLLVIEQETAYTPLWVVTGHDALRVVQEHRPVLFLFDYHLPSMTGLQLYDRLHAIPGFETIPAIIASASLPRVELTQRGIFGLDKPFELEDLLDLIERAIQNQE